MKHINFGIHAASARGAIVFALLAVLLISGSVFAEGEIPVDEPGITPPADTAVIEEPPPADDTGDGEAAAEEETISPSGEPAVEVGAVSDEELSPADLVGVVETADTLDTELVNANGESLNLASQPSADLIISGDPWWMVGTKKYATVFYGDPCPTGTTLGDNCWESDRPIELALSLIEGGLLPTDRKLIVEAGIYDDFIYIDDTYVNLPLLNGIIGAGSGFVTLNSDVFIQGNINGFTLSGFTILGGVYFSDNSGNLLLNDLDVTNTAGTGISIENHSGNVELRNIKSNGNAGDGATIRNKSIGSTVKVTNSSFDRNGSLDNEWSERGLTISCGFTDLWEPINCSQKVVIEGVTASRNLGGGIELNGFSSLTIKNAIASFNEDPYSMESWGGNGISAWTDLLAPITLENIQANFNAGSGISIYSKGSVTAKNIEASYNTVRRGAIFYDDTYWLCLDDECNETEEVTESIRRVEEFLSNDVDYDEWRFEGTNGLDVDIILETESWGKGFDPILRLYDSSYNLIAEDDNSYDGWWNAQILATLTADDIYYIRVYKHEDDPSSRYTLSINYDEGFGANWLGGSGLDFYGREGTGAFRLVNGSFIQNAFDGLSVNNKNTIYVSTITANENGYTGISLDNSGGNWDCSGEECILTGYTGIGGVTVTSPTTTGSFTANTAAGNGYSGLSINSKGSILVSNIDVMENGAMGMDLDNCLRNWDTGVCMGTGTVTINVTIPNWLNGISDNGYDGVRILTNGAVKIDKTSAITNQSDGFRVEANGIITLSNVTAIGNSGFGAYLYTLDSLIPRNVTIIEGMFGGNGNTGLKILTAGAIKLQGVSAVDNQSPEWGTLETIPVTLYDQIYTGGWMEGYNFYGFAGQELAIILTSEDFDAYLELYDGWGNPITSDDNGYGGTDAMITYTIPTDDWYQIFVSYAGVDEFGSYVLSVNDEDRSFPSYPGSGVDLDNSIGTMGVTITGSTISPYSRFNDNANVGMNIATRGVVLITNAGASENFRAGINLNNPSSKAAVTIQDTSNNPQSAFDNNGWDGVYVSTQGLVKLSGISASGNGFSGVDVDNCLFDELLGACLGTGTVNISNKSGMMGQYNENTLFGLRVQSKGMITLINASANDNGLDGAKLKNKFTGSVAGITVNTAGAVVNQFNGNGWNLDYPEELYPGWNGLSLVSNGPLTVTNAGANGNQNMGGGVVINGGYSPVSITNIVANGNDWYGIYATSRGNIIAKDLIANNNMDSGAHLDNTKDGAIANISVLYTLSNINEFNYNNGTGLEITTNGTVTMGNIRAEGNYLTRGWFGSTITTASVHEYYNEDVNPDIWGFYGEQGVPYTIRLNVTDNEDFDPFGFDPYLQLYDEFETLLNWDDDGGGELDSKINFTPTYDGWYYLHVSGLSGDGFYLLGINDPGFEDRTWIWNSGVSVSAGKNVTVGGNQRNQFKNNSLVGLGIYTPGNITVTWVSAVDNGTEGVLLDTRGGIGNVIFNGKSATAPSYLYGNGWHGLSILTDGTATLNHIFATNNGMMGIQVGNTDSPTGKNVLLNNLRAQNNGQSGISVMTKGLITAKQINALDNAYSGAVFVNTFGSAGVSLTGESFINGNGSHGLLVESLGMAIVSNVTADRNQGNGIRVWSGSGNITLNLVSVKYSGMAGIYLESGGNISISSTLSLSNGYYDSDGDGLYIVASPTSLVTIKTSAFMGNEGNGIEVVGANPVILSTWYFGNDTDGDGIASEANLYIH